MSKALPAGQLKVSKLDYTEDNGERYSIVPLPPLQVRECVSFEIVLGPKTDRPLIPFVTFITNSVTSQYAHTVCYVAEAHKYIVTVHNIGPLPTVQAQAAVFIKQL